MLCVRRFVLAAAVGLVGGSASAEDGDISYEGGNSSSAPGYARGKPVSITHSSGNLSVNCLDTDTLTARMKYVVTGSAEGPMETAGKGIGLAAYGDANGGKVSTRVPSKPSGVSEIDVTLTVNIPNGPLTLTVTETGKGWVQVQGCDGTVKISAGAGGAYASGALKGATVTATGSAVKVVQAKDAVFTSTTSLSAPGGNATLVLGAAQGGKITVKGTEVSVAPTVMGTNTATLVSGDLGLAGPTISVSAKDRAEVANSQ
ncbi:MAG: hypothetical protein EXR69_12510 [Myxococcales bacterium]|nr:hypothetical protein [Myxococcales bacterium]